MASLVNIYAAWLIVMNGREKRHECANMGKVKRVELWWQLYVAWLPVRELENFRPLDFCWTEVTIHICQDFMRYLLFWDISQRRLVVRYRRCRKNYGFHIQGSNSPKSYDKNLSLNAGNNLPAFAAKNLRPSNITFTVRGSIKHDLMLATLVVFGT